VITATLPILSMAHRIAAHGTGEGDPVTVPADRWRPLLGMLVTQRLTGLAVAALEDGGLELTPEQRTELLARQRDAMLRALATERTLLELSGSLSEAGVSCVVLKGPALAHTVYPVPEWRPFGDLDLLVHGRDWAAARSAVEALGFHRNVPEPRPGFDVRFGKAATHSNADGLQVDLHRTLVLGPFGLWIEPENLFSATTEFSLGGHRLLRLDDEALFLHACVHASLGWSPPLLLPVRDVVQIGATVRLDRTVTAGRIRAWRLAPVVAHALWAAEELLGADMPALDGILDGIDAGDVERKALLAYTTARRRRGGLDLSMLQAIPGLRAKAAYLRDLLVPSKEFLAARSRGTNGRGSYRRRWSVPLRWMRRNTVHSQRQEDSDVRYRRRP
jgi:hypothetical protein